MECNCEFVINIDRKSFKHYLTCPMIIQKRKMHGEFSTGLPRDDRGQLKLINPHLNKSSPDILYHIALNTQQHDMKKLFGDVKVIICPYKNHEGKFVCMGGTAQRMEEFSKFTAQQLGVEVPSGCGFIDISAASHRYCLYKIGPVISVNHGIGMSTMSVVLQEIIKLLQYAEAKDPIIFRIGTSGGIGVNPGTVVISNKAYDGILQETYQMAILGKQILWPAIFDQCLVEELKQTAEETDMFDITSGGTMGANDFYNGQGRTDGAFCEYNNGDKMEFLNRLNTMGIKNIEMEAPCLAAYTYKAGIKAADVCVTLIDRLKGDQVSTPKDTILEYQKRPMYVICRYMRAYLENIGRYPYGKC